MQSNVCMLLESIPALKRTKPAQIRGNGTSIALAGCVLVRVANSLLQDREIAFIIFGVCRL